MLKKRPQRTCVSCREKREKRDLVRIVLNKDGSVTVDPTGKAPGRGAYLCRNAECIKKELKAHRLANGLKHQVTEEELNAIADTILKSVPEQAEDDE